MTLTAVDWAVIVLYFAVSVAIALVYSRRAGGSSEEFFLSGRALPWWLAGTSIDRKSTRLNSSHSAKSRMPSSA